jgi:hypothetical protein
MFYSFIESLDSFLKSTGDVEEVPKTVNIFTLTNVIQIQFNLGPVDISKASKLINNLYRTYNLHQYPIFILDLILKPSLKI